MNDDRPPIEQVLDVVVYAPIGVALEVQRRLPEFVRDGRRQAEQRIVLARFLGKMAVHVGRQELVKRIDAMRRPPDSTPARTSAVTTVRDASATDVTPATAEEPTVSVDAGAADGGVADALPIPGYDSLSASQVVGRLAALTQDELTAVESYEVAHRSRRTILAKIAQLRAWEG